MVKKVLISAGVVVGLSLLFFGRDAVSYVRMSVASLRDSVRGSIPVEVELQRARQMLKDSAPEIQKAKKAIAKDEVEVRQHAEKIAGLEDRLAKEKEDILRLKGDLEKGKDKTGFEYAGRKYSRDHVQQDLANRFERYKTAEATLADWRKIHSARERSAEASRQKLEGMLAAKRQLEVQLENLEARQQAIAAAETTSSYVIDDSSIGRVKELMAELGTRMEVQEKMIAADGSFHDEIPLHEPAPANVVEQVSQYFNAKPQAESKDLAATK